MNSLTWSDFLWLLGKGLVSGVTLGVFSHYLRVVRSALKQSLNVAD